MHKIISINLNGNAYQVEESGYDALCDYLDGADTQLQGNPDRAEIMSDLEQAIADKCRNFLGPQKTVITAPEVEQIIKDMGPVDGAAAEGDESHSTTDSGPKQQAKSQAGVPKRLYRIREGKMISGVCQGLAAYFGADVTILRIIFIALAVFTHGAGVLVYIVLTFVIPYAQTSEEHAAAFGMPFNAKEFIDQAKEHYADFAQEGTNWKRKAKQQGREWQQAWRRTMRSQRRAAAPNAPDDPAHHRIGRLLVVFGILFVLGVFTPTLSRQWGRGAFDWPLPGTLPLWVVILILIGFAILVTAPFRLMRRASHYAYAGPYSQVIAIWGMILSTVFVTLVIWIAYNRIPEVHYFFQNLRPAWDEFVRQLNEPV